MNVKCDKHGNVSSVKLLAQDRVHWESTQGMCRLLSRALDGDRAGELATKADTALAELRSILDAEPVKKLESK